VLVLQGELSREGNAVVRESLDGLGILGLLKTGSTAEIWDKYSDHWITYGRAGLSSRRHFERTGVSVILNTGPELAGYWLA